MIHQVLKYLGYPDGTVPDAAVMNQIEKACQEVAQASNFQYIYAQYEACPDFMKDIPAYQHYLSGADGLLLCATTLGVQVDRLLKRHQMNDMTYAVIFDAVASAYLEQQADLFERKIPFEHKGFRFCPGYGGTALTDSRQIAALLHAEKIGITFLDSGLMVPLKSMVGIVRLGGGSRKNCADCVAFPNCAFRLKGTTCWK